MREEETETNLENPPSIKGLDLRSREWCFRETTFCFVHWYFGDCVDQREMVRLEVEI